jgi:hypothetical protein
MTQFLTTPFAEISLDNTNAPLFIYYLPYAQPHTPSIATIWHLQQLPTPMDFPKTTTKTMQNTHSSNLSDYIPILLTKLFALPTSC